MNLGCVGPLHSNWAMLLLLVGLLPFFFPGLFILFSSGSNLKGQPEKVSLKQEDLDQINSLGQDDLRELVKQLMLEVSSIL